MLEVLTADGNRFQLPVNDSYDLAVVETLSDPPSAVEALA